MKLLIDIASGGCLLIGLLFVLAGVIGLLRLPDVYTRIHGASVADTAGAAFLGIAMILQAGWSIAAIKLMFMLLIFVFTLPVAGHALARAAQHEGVAPLLSGRAPPYRDVAGHR